MVTGLPSLGTNVYGIRRSLEGLRREAQTVAHAIVDGSTADLAGAAVRSIEHQRGVEANTVALKRANETLGSIIDILA